MAILAGCKTTENAADRDGSVTLTPWLQEYYAQYKRHTIPLFFAVAEDGSYATYTFCDSACRGKGSGRADTIYGCEKYSGGVPCRIYAVGNSVVWDGPKLVK